MTQRDHARAALLAVLDGHGGCEHCHLHYPWRDGSGKHATVEVSTNHEGKWSAYVGLRRPNPLDASLMDVVKQVSKHGNATAAEAIAAIFDGPNSLWPQPQAGGKEGKT